jgi:hypothetical protein
MAETSTRDKQGLVCNNSYEDAIKINEQPRLDKSPMEQVWEAVLGLVRNDVSEDAVKIDEQAGLSKSPTEQVWEAVLTGIDAIGENGASGGSREFVTYNSDAEGQAKTADTLVEMMESGAETAQAKIHEATKSEGSDAVDKSGVKDPSCDTEKEKIPPTLTDLSEMLETTKDILSEMQEKVQEATKEEWRALTRRK